MTEPALNVREFFDRQLYAEFSEFLRIKSLELDWAAASSLEGIEEIPTLDSSRQAKYGELSPDNTLESSLDSPRLRLQTYRGLQPIQRRGRRS